MGVAGVGSVEKRTEASLCCCWYDAGRNWKPEGSPFSLLLPSTLSPMPCVGKPCWMPAHKGVKEKKCSVPASTSQSRKESAGLGAKRRWVKKRVVSVCLGCKKQNTMNKVASNNRNLMSAVLEPRNPRLRHYLFFFL